MCKYSLSDILTISLFAVLSSADDYPEMVKYGKSKLSFLQKTLPHLKSIPSHDTFERVFQCIDVSLFEAVLLRCSQLLFCYEGEYLLNIDGKVLRGTARRRDVVFKEDNCQVKSKNAPQNLSTLRKIALQILRSADDKDSLKVRRKNAGWDEDYILNIVENYAQKT